MGDLCRKCEGHMTGWGLCEDCEQETNNQIESLKLAVKGYEDRLGDQIDISIELAGKTIVAEEALLKYGHCTNDCKSHMGPECTCGWRDKRDSLLKQIKDNRKSIERITETLGLKEEES